MPHQNNVVVFLYSSGNQTSISQKDQLGESFQTIKIIEYKGLQMFVNSKAMVDLKSKKSYYFICNTVLNLV